MRFWSRRRNAQRSALAIHPGSTVKRDLYKAATAGVTGATAFGALAVTGAVAGMAAHDQASKRPEVAPPAAPVVEQVTKRRKHRTIVRTRVVHEVSSVGVASTGYGGIVRSSSSSHTSTHSTSTHSTVTHSAPKPAPAPAPAPSSGS